METRTALAVATALSLVGNVLFCGVVWMAYVARSGDREGVDGAAPAASVEDARWNGASTQASIDSDEDDDDDDTAEKAWRSLGGRPVKELNAASEQRASRALNPGASWR